MQHRAETKRFILRPFETSDLEDFWELDSDPEVHRYLGNEPVQDKETIAKVIEMVRKQYQDNGIGRWAVEDKQTGEVVGWSGLKLEKEAMPFEYYDVGYRIKRKHWGKGIATETAMEAMRYGFIEMELPKIGGGAETEHGASNHILKKIGLNFIDTVIAFGLPHHWYEVSREEWIKTHIG